MIQETVKEVVVSKDDLIMMRLGDLKDGQRELQKRMDRIEQRMDKIEQRMDKLEDKLDDTRKDMNARFDRLADKIDALRNHGQIATISSVGVGVSAVSITLGVLYSLFR